MVNAILIQGVVDSILSDITEGIGGVTSAGKNRIIHLIVSLFISLLAGSIFSEATEALGDVATKVESEFLLWLELPHFSDAMW